MIVEVINYDTKEEVYKDKTDASSLSRVLEELENIQKEKDILGLGKPCSCDSPRGFGFGIRQYQQYENEQCNINIFTESEMSIPKIPDYLMVDGKSTGKRFIFHMYKEGFVLSLGKEALNLLGSPYKIYFCKFTKNNARSSAFGSAKIFNSLKEMKRYIEKYEDYFKSLVSSANFKYSIEYASKSYEENFSKENEKFKKDLSELNEYLNTLNNTNKEKKEREIPEVVDEEAMKNEAVELMKEFDIIKEIINSFKNGNLFMSEGNGILYGLDPNAQVAVKQVENFNLMPYHVIHQLTNFGDMYTVLFVSPNADEWFLSRPEDGYLEAYVYNATTNECSEFGSVRVLPCNGGLVRTE